MAHTSNFHYDVFINHRGKDVKKSFASHLHSSLCLHGMRVFLDKNEMKEGDNLNSQIVGAIKTASVHVAIFSKNYAESNWCLQELVWMWDSLKSGDCTIIPVFYDVKPAALRWTQGEDRGYAKSLHDLEVKTDEGKLRYDPRTIEEWKNALFSVANISGFELEAYKGEEAELIRKIVERVTEIVKKSRFNVPKYEVGLDVKVKDFEDKVLSRQQQSGKPHIVGIVGLGGVGKTTLAKELFHKKSLSYINSCFLTVSQNEGRDYLDSLFGEVLKRLTRSDMQINNVDEVQMLFKEYEPSLEMIQLYPSLVILDAVDDVRQWNELLPIQDVLHSDSLILITSRDRDVLTCSGVEAASIYTLNGLNTQYSRNLFCFHAFHTASPLQGYEYLVDEFLTVCEGLPLLLKVLGAFFYGKNDRSYWEDQLDRFQQILPYEIEKKLKFSYDALNIEEQKMFLDITRFFIGERTETALKIWKGSGWRGLLGFQSLVEKRLVEVDSENCIDMHDHLKDLGKTVAQETRLQRLLWPRTDNNADLWQGSPVITELRRNMDDLLQQSSVIKKQVRGFMLMILIMMIIAIMMMATMIWCMRRRR